MPKADFGPMAGGKLARQELEAQARAGYAEGQKLRADSEAEAKAQADRQAKIAEMVAAETPLAGSVAEAIAILDRRPAPARVERWQKLSNAFAALKDREQYAFFDLHEDAIRAWLDARTPARPS